MDGTAQLQRQSPCCFSGRTDAHAGSRARDMHSPAKDRRLRRALRHASRRLIASCSAEVSALTEGKAYQSQNPSTILCEAHMKQQWRLACASNLFLRVTSASFAENFDAATLEADLTTDSEFARFSEAAKHSNLVPLYERVFADQLTPVTAYRCLVAEDDREAPSFLFESVVNGTQTVSGLL